MKTQANCKKTYRPTLNYFQHTFFAYSKGHVANFDVNSEPKVLVVLLYLENNCRYINLKHKGFTKFWDLKKIKNN